MMVEKHQRHRRSIRLAGYDYAQAGVYFVTICTDNRVCLFGNAAEGIIRLNVNGQMARECWLSIPNHFPAVELDAFVVMPNHVHGIIAITQCHDVGARHAVPLLRIEQFGKPVAGSIPTIIRSFKSAATKQINELRGMPGVSVWQRNYYEHIIRNEESLNRIREYIMNNPVQWEFDRENPARTHSRKENEPWRI